MLTGLELMIKRMETHPEEFVGINGGCTKDWYVVVTPVIPYLTDEEKQTLTSALTQAYREHFNAQTLRKIAGESLVDPGAKTTDYYQGESLIDKINGTSTPRGQAILGGGVITANTITQNSRLLSANTHPSAFGAVPREGV